MFNKVKEKFAIFLIRRRFLNREKNPLCFNHFFYDSKNFLLLMPPDETDFKVSFDLPNYLKLNKREVTLLVPVHLAGYVKTVSNYPTMIYSPEDITKLNLPSVSLVNRLKARDFDVVIDLDRKENYFYGAIANIVAAKFRIGFKKEQNDEFYNLLHVSKDNTAAGSYKSLLNSLRMF